MKKIISIIILQILLLPATVHATTWFSCSGSTECGTTYEVYHPERNAWQAGYNLNGESVWRWTYGAGTLAGNAIATVWPSVPPAGKTAMWVQWYWQYSPNFVYNPISNKQLYFGPSNTIGMTLVGQYKRLVMLPQGPNLMNYGPNISPYGDPVQSFYGTTGVWHKYKAYYQLNTGSNWNGIYKAWVDDVMIADYSNVYYATDATSLSTSSAHFAVIYGGMSGATLTVSQYLYMKNLYIGDSDPGGSPIVDQTPPYTDQHSPAKSSTGVSRTNRTIQFRVRDGVDVLTANGVVNIEGVNYTCSSGLSCTGNGTAIVSVTYTNGYDWNYVQVINVSTSGFRDSAGNVMATDTWQYTIAPDPGPGAPNITTTSLSSGTVGTSASQSFTATGGTSPYTWSLLSGTLPPGKTLTSGGVYSGTPTTAGTYNFTVAIVDSIGGIDNQALIHVINAATPGGQTTVLGTGINDTFINSGAANTNYSTSGDIEVYQWPAATIANRIIIADNSDIQSLPDNITITLATLRMYMTQYEGGGATNPMRVHVKSISGTLPDPATVTWNTFAGTVSSDISVTDISLTPGWYEWNILSAVQAAYASRVPVYLALDGGQDGASDTNRIFASINNTDSTHRPYITITYTELVGPPGPSISTPGKLRVSKFRGRFH